MDRLRNTGTVKAEPRGLRLVELDAKHGLLAFELAIDGLHARRVSEFLLEQLTCLTHRYRVVAAVSANPCAARAAANEGVLGEQSELAGVVELVEPRLHGVAHLLGVGSLNELQVVRRSRRLPRRQRGSMS